MSSNKKQIEKFKDAAKELGCDESEKSFDEKLKKVASTRSKSRPKPKS